MTGATAGHLIDLLETAAGEREQYVDAADVADELGIRGMLSRMVGSRVPPASEAERVYALLWDETLLEARADVDRVLGARAVPYLMFKGGALLGEQYRTGDVWMVDLDVLVPLEARERAEAAFEAEGWPKQDPVGGPSLPGAPGAVFRRPLGGGAISAVEVDVHWRVAPVERVFPWRGKSLPEEVWRSAVRSGSSPVPRAGHHAAMIVHHVVRHDFLHFRGVFDLIQLWPALLASEESAAFASLAASFGVSRVAAWLCRALEADLRLEALGPRGPQAPSARAPSSLRSVLSLVGLELDASDRDMDANAMTFSRGLRRLRTVDRPLRASRTLLMDALVPPDEYLRWRWPGTRAPVRRLNHLSRLLGRLIEDDLTAPSPVDSQET